MVSIRHILFPVDFSERCRAAAPFVHTMASEFGAKVTMLSAVRPIVFTGMEAATTTYIDPEELRFAVQGHLDEFLAGEFEGVEVERKAVVGDAADSITEFAHARKTDLVMMPTHGYGPFRRLLLGSVTAKVLHDVACPVWTEAHVEQTPEHCRARPTKVLCAIDDSPNAIEVMKWADSYARFFSARLHLIHTVPGTGSMLEAELGVELELAVRDRLEAKLTEVRKAAGINATLYIAVGDIADTVRAEAERHSADVLIVGRGVIHETLGRLRTQAHSIIRHAPCPVISI